MMNFSFRNADKGHIVTHGILTITQTAFMMIGAFIAIVCLIDYANTGFMPHLRYVYFFGGGVVVIQIFALINAVLAVE